MIEVVIVYSFLTKCNYYLSSDYSGLNIGDYVIFDDDYGTLIGKVINPSFKAKRNSLYLPLKKIIRKATDSDINLLDENTKVASDALVYARKISSSLGLDMNFFDSYFYLDHSQMVFLFLSDNRVDFRDLAKKLASKYKTRIELHQVGVRDKAKIIGGIGPCGLFLCCNVFLSDFNSVSINMAKNQMLALNPSKINGICGRLLCCLSYENDTYSELKNNLPDIGLNMDTPFGYGKVTSVNIFKNSYSVDIKDYGVVEFDLDGSVK